VIGEVERHHGAALARLVRHPEAPSIEIRAHGEQRSAYVLGERIALYVKYSTSRLTPWRFAFRVEHQQEVAELRAQFEHVFIVLVCGFEGIVCLSAEEYQRVLDDDPRRGEWIKARRGPRQKYSVSGSDDREAFKIADNEYPMKVFDAISV
jgi:hypothetical protein